MISLSNPDQQRRPAGSPGGTGGQFAPGIDALIRETRAGSRGKLPRKITIAHVGGRLASEVRSAVGVDAAGWPIELDEDVIRKNDKVRRNPKVATDHGFLPAADVDYHRLPDVMSQPDAVEKGIPRPEGTATVNVYKRFNGFVYAAVAVRTGRRTLAIVRLVRLGKGSAQLPRMLRATPGGGVAPTSETTSGIVEPNPDDTQKRQELSMRSDGLITLDRGTRGDEGHFVTIDHHVVFIRDDHGHGANGRGGSFTKHGLEHKLVKHHEAHGGNWMEEHRNVLAEGSGGDLLGRNRFTFHGELPSEVKRHIENNPAARRLFTVTNGTSVAGGADALASMGDRYWDMVDDAAGGQITKALATADGSDDPEVRFHAALYRELPKQKTKQGIVAAEKLRAGHRFTINGRDFTVRDDAENGLTLDGGRGFPETPVHALSEIPIDKYSLRAPRGSPRPKIDVADIPFSRAGEEALIELAQGSLFGETTGGPQGHLFEQQADHEGRAGHWVTMHGRHVFIRDGETVGDALARQGHVRPAQAVDPNRQLGMFARDADGNPVEVGERPGQGALFHDAPKPPVPGPSAEDRQRAEARAATTPMFDESGVPETSDLDGAAARDLASPRDRAGHRQRSADDDYAFARESAVPNAGEDLKGSARHRVNAWKTLADAEADGTAGEQMTRDNLLKHEPHDFLGRVTEANALTALAMHHAVAAMPGKPRAGLGNSRATGDKFNDARNRGDYYGAYGVLKAAASEALDRHPDRPELALRHVQAAVTAHIRKLRGEGDPKAEYTDRYNPTANDLIPLQKRLSAHAYHGGKTGVAAKVGEFAQKLRAKYGEADGPALLARVAEHARDVIEGASLNETFGTKAAGGRRAFSPADAYVKHAARKGGRVIDATTVEKGTGFVINELGMRGLQWGNSVSDEERIHHLSRAAEAMADLADVTGLDDRHMSIGGKLGLAIGARGKGRAMAHYEPTGKVINLTRKNGVGSLAHEWGHALDHDLAGGGTTAGGGDYLSEHLSPIRAELDPHGGPMTVGGKLRTVDRSNDPVWSSMHGVRKAMADSGFVARLRGELGRAVDEGLISRDHANKYWDSGRERFARAFETHVKHKLGAMGRENTYLSGIDDTRFWPNAQEAARMAPAFDGLMAAVRTHHFGGKSAAASPTTALSASDDGSRLYLAADATFAPALTLGQGLPTHHNELPIIYRWVDAAVCGNWRHPRTGQPVPIDADRVKGWVKNIKLALSRRVDLPAVRDHRETADASMGALYDARERQGRLQLLTGFFGEKEFEVAQKNKVSVGIDSNFRDSHGHRYGESIRHLAFTPVPVIHGQQGFVGLSRGEPNEPIYLSLAPTEGLEMKLDPALMGRVEQLLGNGVTNDPAAIVGRLLERLATAAPQSRIDELSAAVEDRDAQIEALSVGLGDPEALRDRADLYEERVELLLSAGDVSKVMADRLKAYIRRDGKPNVLMLSTASGSAKRPIDDLIELFKGAKLGQRGAELTDRQTLLLSRADPDGGRPAAADAFDANPLIVEARRLAGHRAEPAVANGR